MDDRGLWILYYALAAAAAIVLALPSPTGVLGFAVIVGCGVGAAVLRSQWLHARAWSRADLSWGLVFLVVLVPLALLLRGWPFGR